MLLKARPDILHEHFIVDLKTSRDASPKGFQRSMCEGGYHIQAAMIIDAVKAIDKREVQTFINIVIEKEYPFSVGVYVIDQAAVEFGRTQYKTALRNLKVAREANSFLDYETQVIGLPNWYEGGL